MTVRVFAPAKINLALHVIGRRDDGYHLIDSLVTFAPVRDRLIVQGGNTLSLTVEGPEARGVPADMNNLALRAAEIFADGAGASLLLEKHLPSAAGIGGGSADAAAAIRGMLALRQDWVEANRNAGDGALQPIAQRLLALGADVPMCLLSKPCRARGVGEKLEFVQLPPLPAILVNPRVAVPTGAVFSALKNRENPPMPDRLPDFSSPGALIDWLAGQRNDLERPAIESTPEIDEVLNALTGTRGCRLARMSGSGATCFGLYDDKDAMMAAGSEIRGSRPDWWLAGGILGDQSRLAEPVIS